MNEMPNRLGCILNLMPRQKGIINGLGVANLGFVNALLRHGSYREIHVFTSTLKADNTGLDLPPDAGERVRVLPIDALPFFLTEHDYAAMHVGDPYIDRLVSLRQSFARSPFPVLGRTHALCGDPSLNRFRDVLLSPHEAWDGVLCSGPGARTVMQRTVEEVIHRTREEAGVELAFRGHFPELPLGVDPEQGPLPSREDARRALGLPEHAVVLLSLGRITAVDKADLHPLLLAVNELVEERQRSGLVLIIAGAVRNAQHYLEALFVKAHELGLGGVVRFEMDPDEPGKRQLLAASDVMVSLADHVQETFGLVPLEAMAAGLPVVLSDWNGYRHLIDDGREGFLIPTTWDDFDGLWWPFAWFKPEENLFSAAQTVALDLPLLVDRLDALIHRPDLRRAMGEAGRQRVAEKFSWDVVVHGFESIVQQAWSRGPETATAAVAANPLPVYQRFGHYATARPGEPWVLETSERGKRVLEESESLWHFEGLAHLVQRPVLMRILEEGCLPLSTEMLAKKIRLPESMIRFHAMMLLKHGLISTPEPPLTAHPVAGRFPGAVHEEPLTVASASADSDEASSQARDEIHARSVTDPGPGIDALLTPLIHDTMKALHPCIERLTCDGQGPLQLNLCHALRNLLLDRLLQALAWWARKVRGPRDAYPFQEVVDELLAAGGMSALTSAFPVWARAVSLDLQRFQVQMGRLMRRVRTDLFEVSGEMNWASASVKGRRIVGIQCPRYRSRGILDGTCVLVFEPDYQLMYKARDLRLCDRVIGAHDDADSPNESLAEWINARFDDGSRIPTCRVLPRVDLEAQGMARHYGYMAYMPFEDARHHRIQAEKADGFFHSLGMISAMAVLAGLGDLHHANLVVSDQQPHLIDVDSALTPSVAQSLARLLMEPQPFSENLENTPLDATKVLRIWQSHHHLAFDDLEWRKQDDQLVPVPNTSYHPVFENAFMVDGFGHGMELEPGVFAACAKQVTTGFSRTVHACLDEVQAFLAHLESLAHVPSRFVAVGNVFHAQHLQRQGLRGHFIHREWESWDRAQHRAARRLCLQTEDARSLLPRFWRDPVTRLSRAMAEDWRVGMLPDFSFRPCETHLRHVRVMDEVGPPRHAEAFMEAYFPLAPLDVMSASIRAMAQEPGRRNRIAEDLAQAFGRWLESLKPSAELPDAVRQTLVNWLEKRES